MKEFLRYVLLFVVVVALQVLLFNNINLFGLINIYIYTIFIMSLPVGMSKDLQMILAFLLGLCVDIFTNTLGMHIFASVFVAFFRNGIIERISSKQEFDAGASPSVKTLGKSTFFKYAFLMVFLHNLVLFPLEDPEFKNIPHTLLMILCSVPVSYMLVVAYYLLKKK